MKKKNYINIFYNIGLSILFNIIFGILCFSPDYPNKEIYKSKLIFSIVFILIWFTYGVFIGKHNNKKMLVTSVCFWAISILLVFVDVSYFIYYIPLIGLEYFDVIRNITSTSFGSLLLPLLTMIIVVIGYFIGNRIFTSKILSGNKN